VLPPSCKCVRGKTLGDVRVLYNTLIAPVPKWLLIAASRLVGSMVRDAVLTRDEVKGLTANLLVSRNPPRASTRFSDWLAANAQQLGVEWASELRWHYA
jgi:NADH dehydrogenase